MLHSTVTNAEEWHIVKQLWRWTGMKLLLYLFLSYENPNFPFVKAWIYNTKLSIT